MILFVGKLYFSSVLFPIEAQSELQLQRLSEPDRANGIMAYVTDESFNGS